MLPDLRLLLCLCTALTFAPRSAEASSVMRIRTGGDDAQRRVVLDLYRSPKQTPVIDRDDGGFRADLGNGEHIRLPARQGHLVARSFLLKAADGKPARFVIDFVKSAPAPAQQAAAVMQPVAQAEPPAAPVQDAMMADELAIASSAPPAKNSALRLSGFVEAEGRWFTRTSDDGITRRYFGSVAAEPSLRWTPQEGQRITITGFARAETGSTRRTHADLRDAKYEGNFGALDVTLGLDRRFWGQLEAAHLVDVINQIDTLEDIDAEDKLGQPLASLKWSGRAASVELFALPWFRDRRYPNRADRPNALLPVRGESLRDGTSTHWTPDFAVRGTLTAGVFDLAAFYFDGLAREPRLLPTQNGNFIIVGIPDGLRAVHDRTRQIGGDALAVLGPLRLKAEGSYRWNRNDRFAAAPASGAFGFGGEYSFGSVIGGADINLLAEYYHDSRGRSAAVFDNDLFLGLRFASNDVSSTEILAGAVIDLKRRSKLINIEASRRIGSAFTVLVDARLPVSVSPDDALYLLRDDGFVQIKLRYNF